MWILSIVLLLIFSGSAWLGSRRSFHLDQLTPPLVLNSLLSVLVFFTFLIIANSFGYFPQSVAAPFMMGLYIAIGGFFFGYAFRLYQHRSSSGLILYQNRSFWVDHAPNLLAVAIIIFGLYRTSILTDLSVTGIRITSGLSLVGFGLFTWTLKPVPEFRKEGVLILDRRIPWPDVVSWHWQSETILVIEFLAGHNKDDQRIKQFTTSIPEMERKEIETVLKSKMEEFADERRKRMFEQDEA
ncbi:hypothetical protein [Rhodohalobacter halophilus]|uniref:hypothetical protein n=1 Tax=Rhodohalobacter halophilus TaxID=1812810 RepID=UPI00083FA52D|nr:hypothetical protein [Rhodohalobacter halophilus]